MKLFDTHCHLAGSELKSTAVECVQNAIAAGVGGFAIISADEASLKDVETLSLQLRAQFPAQKFLYTSGVHPHDASKISDALWKEIETSAFGGASAIGETGLDYYYEHSDRKLQQEYFLRHIDLACRTKKPLVIHCREAKDDVLSCLDSAKGHPNPGILHCFTEDLATAKDLVDRGFFISFSGILTFKNAARLQEIAKALPVDRILIETDSPWLAPIPMRGKQNQPAFVSHVFQYLADLKKLPEESLSQILWENSCRVYQIASN